MPGIGAQGFVGVALETTQGTYAAPTKFVPIMSESLQYQQETVWRRPIRQSADIIGAVDGNVHIEGDITMEAFESVVAMFLHASRTSVIKSDDGSGNFTYVFKGITTAVPAETMSLTVVRNDVVFAYTGCVVGSFTITVEDGQLMFNPSILGRDEETQSAPVPTWDTGIEAQPYGAGRYDLQIPTSTQVFDTDTFEFSVDDSAEAQYRLKNNGRGAQFISFGERSVTLTVERDFEDRTDYDDFKALTAQSITMLAEKGEDNSIQIEMPASIKDSYELGLSGQGDLIRASVAYNGVIDASGDAYEITIKTQEDIGD